MSTKNLNLTHFSLNFRDVKNLERFSLVVQCITRIALIKLKQLPDYLKNLTEKKEEGAESKEEEKKKKEEEKEKEEEEGGGEEGEGEG